MYYRFTTIAAAFSVLLAAGALLFLAWWPDFYQGERIQTGPEGASVITRSSESLISNEGLGVLWLLAIPAFLAVVGLAGALRQSLAGRLVLWLAAFLLVGYAFVTGFTIGPFYVPAALALLVSAITHRYHAGAAPA